MGKITQEKIADYLGVSNSMLSLVRSGKKHFGRETAIRVGPLLKLPPEMLNFQNGEDLYFVIRAVCIQLLSDEG